MDKLYPHERFMVEAEDMGIEVHEKIMPPNMPGLYYKKVIHMEDRLTYRQKNCVMAEEIGHHLFNVGNILDQSKVVNRKQELLGRAYAYQRLVSPRRLVEAFRYGCCGLYETCQYLDVTEKFFIEAIHFNARRYGLYTYEGEYIIFFDAPSVNVRKRGEYYSA